MAETPSEALVTPPPPPPGLPLPPLPLTVAAALVACVPAGLGRWLDAADLCRLARLCSECHQLRGPAFWSWLDLSSLPCQTSFFEHGASRTSQFARVVSLTVQFCDLLRDDHLAVLPPSVEELMLDACSAITDAGVKSVSATCGKRLRRISLYCCHRLGTPSALALSIRCPSLTALSLSGCKLVAAAGFLALASRCRALRELNLTRLPLVDDTSLAAIAQNNPGLRDLRVYSDSQLTNGPLLAVAKHCAMLHTLDCTGLGQLEDAVLLALGHHCSALRVLLLTWVVNVSDEGVCAVARGCRQLRTLSLHGIKGVGVPSLEALVESCALTLVALDVRGCVGIDMHNRSPAELTKRLPRLTTFALAT